MFHLDEEILRWRNQLRSAGISSTEALDELESHLRDEYDALVRAGHEGPEAFRSAVARIGSTTVLQKEFTKINRPLIRILRGWKEALLRVCRVSLPVPIEFEPNVMQALDLAQHQARSFNHDFVGTEHVLLALIQYENGSVSRILAGMGAGAGAVRLEIERMVVRGDKPAGFKLLRCTPRALRALLLAAKQARALNDSLIRSEHLLLALMEEGSGVAALALKNLDIRTESLRKAVLNYRPEENPGA